MRFLNSWLAQEETMGGDNSRAVLVLTERPDDYSRDLGRLGLKPHFASQVSGLLDRLQDTPACGFVLRCLPKNG